MITDVALEIRDQDINKRLSDLSHDRNYRVLEVKDYLKKDGSITCPCCGYKGLRYFTNNKLPCPMCNAQIKLRGDKLIVQNPSLVARGPCKPSSAKG